MLNYILEPLKLNTKKTFLLDKQTIKFKSLGSVWFVYLYIYFAIIIFYEFCIKNYGKGIVVKKTHINKSCFIFIKDFLFIKES